MESDVPYVRARPGDSQLNSQAGSSVLKGVEQSHMHCESTTGNTDLILSIDPIIDLLMKHPLYSSLGDEQSLRLFMRTHVFAVWDFQSLLKGLQRSMTCVDLPWLPTVDPIARRLINEIVLDEESDEAPDGTYLSHFELYVKAMEACGADTAPIRGFWNDLVQGMPVEEALAEPAIPRGVASFVSGTLAMASSGSPHRMAAAFAYGREEVIPGMFRRVVDGLTDMAPERWMTFRYYLERHVGIDADVHGPAAKRLVSRLCGTDSRLWSEAEEAARLGLEARLRLWDETHELLSSERRMSDV